MNYILYIGKKQYIEHFIVDNRNLFKYIRRENEPAPLIFGEDIMASAFNYKPYVIPRDKFQGCSNVH